MTPDPSEPKVLDYAAPRRPPPTPPRVPVDEAGAGFIGSAWIAWAVLGPMLMLLESPGPPLCVLVTIAMLFSNLGGVVMSLCLLIRWSLERRPLVVRSKWAVRLAGIAWPLGVVVIVTAMSGRAEVGYVGVVLLGWSLFEPAAASLLIVRRAA